MKTVRLANPSNQMSPLSLALVTAGVLAVAFYLGRHASLALLVAPLGVMAAFAILRQPRLGLFAVIAVALFFRVRIGTGSEVYLYPVALLVPALVGIWLLASLFRRQFRLPASSINLPLVLFLVMSLLSLFIGNLIWDPAVPRKSNFLLVQLAQWAIFAFSACALWLTAVLADSERRLQQLTLVFLLVGGSLAVLRVIPPFYDVFVQISSGAVDRAPFWVLLVGLAGGQLLFNPSLPKSARLALVLLIGVSVVFALVFVREVASYWVGIVTVLGVLVWLRFPRLRIPILLIVALMLATGLVTEALWNFAGGDDEWTESGASRLVLIQRVVEVTMRNPITGLGPAAYRPYVNVKPLPYQRAFWINPQINSHNNYVDLFSFTGLIGLGVFLWFLAATALLAGRLHRRYRRGFVAGYVNGMLACLAGVIVLMFLLDWFVPSVYNVSFYGFQASVLVWLFLGGLVAIDQWPTPVVPDSDRVARRSLYAKLGSARPIY